MKLLIVEDETELIATLVRFLSRAGHSCATALNYQAAMDHIARSYPQLVITNYQLPDGDGLGVIKAVRQKYPLTPVILMTGYHTPTLEEAARKAGAAAYLRKPFALTALAAAIRSV